MATIGGGLCPAVDERRLESHLVCKTFEYIHSSLYYVFKSLYNMYETKLM